LKRRDFARFAALAALLAWRPLLAQKIWRIGFLAPIRRPTTLQSHRYNGFLQGLREAGYIEGRNLVIDWRWADDEPARLPALAAELVRLRPDVLVAAGSIAAREAQRATSSVPIIMLGIGDPVGAGLVRSLARPGGNATGVSLMNPDLGGKWLEIARSILPTLSRAALFINPANPAFKPTLDSLVRAGSGAGVTVTPVEVASPGRIPEGFARVQQVGASVLFVQNESMFDESSRQIAEHAMRAKLPTITGRREFVESGCLASYGSNLTEMYRRAAGYVDRVLKGAKPAEMPIEQPTSYELAVNAKSAKALGITLPRELILRADRVIE